MDVQTGHTALAAPTTQRVGQPLRDIRVGEARINRIARQRPQVDLRPSERLAAKGVLPHQAGPQQDQIVGVDRHDGESANELRMAGQELCRASQRGRGE